mmetsp:Transcript_5319/g.15481  ORF Transcript_5319/g.15481 Transcript_5319/m.15481 type:complete len:264 (+) Transcript_5319:628-1419(+)
MAQVRPPQYDVPGLHGNPPRSVPLRPQDVAFVVGESDPVGPSPPNPLGQRGVQPVRPRPAHEAPVPVLLLIPQRRRALYALQADVGGALIEVLPAGADLVHPAHARPPSPDGGVGKAGRVAHDAGTRRAVEGEPLLARVEEGGAVERLEDAARELLAQVREEPTPLVRLAHVGEIPPAGVRPRVERFGCGGAAFRGIDDVGIVRARARRRRRMLIGVPGVRIGSADAGRRGLDEGPQALVFLGALLPREDGREDAVPVVFDLF